MNTIIYKLALQRSRRLDKIASTMVRPLSSKTLHLDMLVASDNAIAKADNEETTYEMAERFRTDPTKEYLDSFYRGGELKI